MIDENELLFNELYEKTKDCGRVQFINLLMTKERENKQLKKQLEDFKINQNNNPFENSKYRNTGFMEGVEATETKYINKQKEFIEYLENEKDRLSRECSQIYEDSLGKTKLVNEDIFNEVDTILSKYKEIIGVSNDNQKIMERNIRRNKKSKKYK